jgi:hypothetical protein
MLLLQAAALFAQANKQPPPPPDAGGIAAFLVCYGVVIALAIVVRVLFLLTLSRCLGQCSPRNRTMEPGLVWLNLIPLFDIVWMFITIIKLSESLRNEYRDRGLPTDDPDFGQMMGILYMVFSFFCAPVALVLFIMYWVKIAGFKNQLMSGGGLGGYDDDLSVRPKRSAKPVDDDLDDYDDYQRR